MAVETVQVDNSDMWSSATTQEPAPEAAPPPSAPEEPPQRARDPDTGQFVKQETPPETPSEAPKEQPEAPEEAAVPSWRLREIREERDQRSKALEEANNQLRAYQQQMAEMDRRLREVSTPKPVEDIWQNPDGYVKQQFAPFEQQLHELRAQTLLNSSKALAIAQHGPEPVAEMEKAIEEAYQQDPGGMQRTLGSAMQNSGDPIGIAMKWYQSEKLRKEVGNDLNAYNTKLREKLLKDPAFLAEAIEAAKGQAHTNSQSQPPNIKLPVSLSKVSGSAASVDDNDDSNEGMWRSATAGLRRR
jgi:hypothetical protein